MEPFHLGGVHSAVGLSDVDDWLIQVGEDIGAHSTDAIKTLPRAIAVTATRIASGWRKANPRAFILYAPRRKKIADSPIAASAAGA